VGQDEEKFVVYSKLAIQAASVLAPFESPTYRAVAVTDGAIPQASAARPGKARPESDAVPFPRDPVAASRLYLRMMSATPDAELAP
jgi:hypothetical protein